MGVRVRNIIFFKSVEPEMNQQMQKKMKTITESLSTPSLIVVEQTKKVSYSESALLSFIREGKIPTPGDPLVI